MIHISKKISFSLPWKVDGYSKEELLFFDIETTGLSASVSSLYLIGCLSFVNGQLTLNQWFADDYISEASIITAFFEYSRNYRLLVHYNGSGFDFPYITQKCEKYNIPSSLGQICSLDLYKEIKLLKGLLAVENLKQKTMEQFLGFHRKDCFSGKELIEFYSQYMQCKILKKPYDSFYQPLLLHNEEDLCGLLFLTRLLSYPSLFTWCREETSPFPDDNLTAFSHENNFIFTFFLPFSLPVPVSIKQGGILLSLKEMAGELTVPAFKGELKYFFTNYRDYYYLPDEDTAVHKSVAQFVNPKFRQKAKASNCYIRRQGTFLPQFAPSIPPVFREDFKSKPFYFLLESDFLENKEIQKKYIKELLAGILPKAKNSTVRFPDK